MKKWIAALALFAGMAPGASRRSAARLSAICAAAAAARAYRWMGPYVGANVGYQWGDIDNNPTQPSGIAGGIQAGYNWQNGNFVFGGETDINLSGADDTFAPWKFSNPWFGTLRGRVGRRGLNNFLFYGTGGLAYGGLEAEFTGCRRPAPISAGPSASAPKSA